MSPNIIQMVGAALFAIAIIHTFSTKYFEQLAHRRPAHSGLWHLLGEVEVVFGIWATILVIAMMLLEGRDFAVDYLDSRNYTEPLFVFVIMVIAASKPVLRVTTALVDMIARYAPLPGAVSTYFTILAVVPLLGSLITEPAAMTLAALLLRDRFYQHNVSRKLMYGTLGTLFVNISIGGTLTSFAAPPVLMVAHTWQWDSWFMLSHFGWKAATATVINATIVTLLFQNELRKLPDGETESIEKIPTFVTFLHLLLLLIVVVFAHHPPIFVGIFLFFMGIASAYPNFQERLILREGLLVAFFLAGLVVLGGQQAWWLQPLLENMDATTVYFGATALTAITDNAALTYLGSLVSGLSADFKYALVAGAVTGGGLTVIANAPNPAGFSILRRHFNDGAVNPLGLFVSALPPTLVAIFAFQLL